MSVVIRGMEMPENCRECRFQDYVFTSGVTLCGASCVVLARNFEAIGFDGRPDWCPLVDLGKHGRLIDADKLMDDIKKNSASYFADDFAREWVDVQPTVIEAEDEG